MICGYCCQGEKYFQNGRFTLLGNELFFRPGADRGWMMKMNHHNEAARRHCVAGHRFREAGAGRRTCVRRNGAQLDTVPAGRPVGAPVGDRLMTSEVLPATDRIESPRAQSRAQTGVAGAVSSNASLRCNAAPSPGANPKNTISHGKNRLIFSKFDSRRPFTPIFFP
jgi:hypothetical protein